MSWTSHRIASMDCFAKALRGIPSIICDNAGLDSGEIFSQLRARHAEGETNMGVNVLNGQVGDMTELGISESFRVKQQVLLSATEAAEMIVRVHDIIKCAPRQRAD